MPDINLKEELLSLVKLQAVDSEIFTLNAKKNAAPQEIKALESAFEQKKQQLSSVEKQLLDLQKERKDKESELAAKEESTKKLQGQLFSLKTNKEYSTMQQQIADSKADASVIEDKILSLFDAADAARKRLDEEKTRLQAEEKLFLDEKKKVEARVKEIDDRLCVLAGQRSQVLPSIEPKILAQYERILHSRDGLAIAVAKGNSCMGCNMFVPPQAINLIKMYDRIITCEVCNRILYTED